MSVRRQWYTQVSKCWCYLTYNNKKVGEYPYECLRRGGLGIIQESLGSNSSHPSRFKGNRLHVLSHIFDLRPSYSNLLSSYSDRNCPPSVSAIIHTLSGCTLDACMYKICARNSLQQISFILCDCRPRGSPAR